MDKDKVEAKRKARVKFVWGMILFTILWVIFAERSEAQEWGTEPNVYFNTTYHPYTTIPYIEYALWSIKQRTGRSGVYAGSTTQDLINDAIVARWEDGVSVQNETGCTSCLGWTWWDYTNEGYFTDARVILNSDYQMSTKVLIRVILHELGHAFGADIHHNYTGVFYSVTQSPYDYAITTADVMELPYSNRSLCHVELTLQNDLFIPDIQGQQVMLRYTGNGTTHSWSLPLGWMAANPFTQGCTGNSIDENGIITLPDVRSFSGNYTNVKLAPLGVDTWQLDEQ